VQFGGDGFLREAHDARSEPITLITNNRIDASRPIDHRSLGHMGANNPLIDPRRAPIETAGMSPVLDICVPAFAVQGVDCETMA
jgi:hypothetical protein